LVKVKKAPTSWQKFTATLRSAPLISDILTNAQKMQKDFKKSELGKGAKQVSDNIEDMKEEVTEKIETSQHPWVYAVSNAWDELQEETPDAQLLRELHRIDPSFDMYDFLEDVSHHYLPEFLKAFYGGDATTLENLCTSRYNTIVLKSEIERREKEGIVMDPTVLEVEEASVIKALPTGAASEYNDPGMLVACKTEVIHCLMNKKGEIIEGGPDKVQQVQVFLIMVRQYSRETNTVQWRIEEVQQMTVNENYM